MLLKTITDQNGTKKNMKVIKEEYKQFFREMCDKIDIPQYNNAMEVSEYVLRAIKNFRLSLPDIEKILREINSRVYLIGFPLSWYNTGDQEFVAKNLDKNNCDFALWIEVNGSDTLEDIIKKYKWTEQDIDRSLNKTGLLMIG